MTNKRLEANFETFARSKAESIAKSVDLSNADYGYLVDIIYLAIIDVDTTFRNDHKRMELLESKGVDKIYFNDGTEWNPSSMSLRTCCDLALIDSDTLDC